MSSSNFVRVAAACAVLAIPQFTAAATAICVGKITGLGNHANGSNGLLVSINNSPSVRVCSFSATQFTVTAEDCRHMASLAATAFAMDVTVVLYVDNAPTTDCAALPNYILSNTRYMGIER
jgi:hypothetical protein